MSITRRHLFAAAPVTGLVAAAAPSTRPASRRNGTSVDHAASVADFGAIGDGRADDTAAFRAALNAARMVVIPPGSFRISDSLKIGNGQILTGAGASGWDPYDGSGPARSAPRSEIVLDGGLAFDARGSNNAAIEGLAIRARGGHQSGWGRPPGFQPGTVGIDIASALQFSASGISFHGLETGVSSVANTGMTAQMPRIGEWSAEDCGTVFRFVSGNREFVPVRDARIDGCIAALHCGRIVEARHCDGLRIENVRFYQCTTHSILVEDTPFVIVVGATLFETAEETIVLRNCAYVTIAGTQVCRSGYYRGKPLLQRAAVVLENCTDLSFQGLVEQPVGRAFTITGCTNVSINAAIGTPFWSTGSLGSNDGAIWIERSRSVAINASFGGTDYWMAVCADAASATGVAGQITTEGSAGVLRCVQLQSAPLGHVTRTNDPNTIPAGGSVVLDTLRILVPPGRSLVSRSVELTSPGVIFTAGSQRWAPEKETEPGGGSLSLERKVLYRNDDSKARYATIEAGVHNPTGTSIVVPAGHESRLSLAWG